MKDFQNISVEKISGNVPPLDKIVLKLNVSASNAKSDIIDHVIIQYDRKNAEAEKLIGSRFSLASLLGLKKLVEYYRIDTYRNATVTFSQIYKAKHPEYGEMDITINYTMSAIEGGEIILVKELMRRDTPTIMLENKMNDWVVNTVSENITNLFTNFGKFAANLGHSLSVLASNTGLKLDAIVTFKSDLSPKETIKLSAKKIQVQPKGYNDYFNLDFDAVLVPDKQFQSETLVALGYKNRNGFQNLFAGWLQDYIRETVTYNDIASYLHFKVRIGLIEYWNMQLRKENKGWIAAELVLHSDTVPPATFKFERLEIEGALRNAKVLLTNTILLNLEDAERFKNSRVENLETWIKEKLQQTAHNVLTKVSYAELVSDIEQLGGIIKSHLDKQAFLIGYRVEYLLTSELVDKARLNFQFQFHEEEQIFQTTLHEKMNLDINIAGRIRSLNHDTWRSTLTPETDFVQVMKKEVLRVVRQLLLKINADDFYTKFNESVEPKLVNEIKNLLVKDFNVDPSVDISPQMGVSFLRALIIELQRGQQTVKINCFGGGATFGITFSVMRVDPVKWSLFASRSYTTAAEIKGAIGERIRIFVENAVRLMISDINILKDARIFGLIDKYARESDAIVREKLGLVIDVIDVEQLNNTLADIITGKNLLSAEGKIKILMDGIRKTEEEILDAMINGDDDWELQSLIDKKAKLQSTLDNENFDNNKLSYKSGKVEFDNLLNIDTDINGLGDVDNEENHDSGEIKDDGNGKSYVSEKNQD